jgi:diadenosine tetraphosphate (Ap4A) HIT family hydrolase
MHCDFCDEFRGGHRNAFTSRYGQTADRNLLAGAGSFQIVPSLGQVVEGHLLILPVAHHCALAEMRDEELEELERLCHEVRLILRDVYGECVLFEHGVRTEDAGGCGIDHAHMHAIPVAADGVLNTLKQEFSGRRIDSLQAIKQSLSDGLSYLVFEDASRGRYIFPVNKLPSQYLRKLVAESIGKTEWNWRQCGHEPELISTLERLSPLFSAIATAQRG